MAFAIMSDGELFVGRQERGGAQYSRWLVESQYDSNKSTSGFVTTV